MNPYLSESVMAKHFEGRFSPQQIELIIIALAAHRDLTPAQLKQNWQGQIGFWSPRELKRALINAVGKRRLTFPEAQEIASIIGERLYNR